MLISLIAYKKRMRNIKLGKVEESSRKEKLIIRIFLALFIIAIFFWLIPSTIGFINLDSEYGRAGELPQWLKDTSAFQRAIIILIFVQLSYLIIAVCLFVEFLKPNIRFKYNKDKLLTVLSVILIIIGLIAVFLWSKNGISTPIYDTIIYGFGFGILFLLSINYYSIWMKILLWARLIEVWGPLIGYNAIPAAFGKYTGGAFGHFGYGLQGMITSPHFWTDFSVQLVSAIGVMYLLKKAGFKWFWIISFSIGAVIIGLALIYILPTIF